MGWFIYAVVIIFHTHDIIQLGCADLDQAHIFERGYAVLAAGFIFNDIPRLENFRDHATLLVFQLDLQLAAVHIDVLVFLYMVLQAGTRALFKFYDLQSVFIGMGNP